MTKVSVARKTLLSLLNSLGNTIGDLRLKVNTVEDGQGFLVAAIGYYTHYMQLSIPCTIESGGGLAVSDVSALKAFLKSGKIDTVSLQQDGQAKTLYVSCGNSKVHFPGSGQIASYAHVAAIERILQTTAENNWTKWGDRDLSCSATINASSTEEITSIHSILGENPLYTVDFYPENAEMIVKAGKKSKGRMFVTVPTTNTKGPEHKCTSVFGANFPINMKALPEGNLLVHMGDDAPIIFRHEDSGSCLIVFDCDFEEGWE